MKKMIRPEAVVKTYERTNDFGTIEVHLARTQDGSGPAKLLHLRVNIDRLGHLAAMVRKRRGHCMEFGSGALTVFFAARD